MADNPVLAPVNQLIDGLLRVMKAGHAVSFSDRFNMLAPVIDKTFDLNDRSLRESGWGLTWQSMPPDQQAALGAGVSPLYCSVLCQQLRRVQRPALPGKSGDCGPWVMMKSSGPGSFQPLGRGIPWIMSCTRIHRVGVSSIYSRTGRSAGSRCNGRISADSFGRGERLLWPRAYQPSRLLCRDKVWSGSGGCAGGR